VHASSKYKKDAAEYGLVVTLRIAHYFLSLFFKKYKSQDPPHLRKHKPRGILKARLDKTAAFSGYNQTRMGLH